MTPPALLICLWTQKAHTDIEGHFSTTKDCKLRDMPAPEQLIWGNMDWSVYYRTPLLQHTQTTYSGFKVKNVLLLKYMLRQLCCCSFNNNKLMCEEFNKRNYTVYQSFNPKTYTQSTRSVFLNIRHPQSCTIAANQPNEPKIAAVIRRH